MKKKPGLKGKAKYLARPLETRPRDMNKLLVRQTMRHEFLTSQDAAHRKNERDRIGTMLNENISPQMRATLIKTRDKLK
jgi:hypothetical protein